MLARRNGVETSISLAEGVHEVFPRGLAVARDMIVGCGDWAEDRPGRKGGTTRILVLNRRSLATVLDVAIGEYGNLCDILCTSEHDLTDRHPAFWTAFPTHS